MSSEAAVPAVRPEISLKMLISLAWPIVISRMTQTVVGLSDALMVSHLGAAALAATSTGAINSFAVMILPLGLTFIVSSFSAQYFGKGDPVAARRYGWYGLIIAAFTQVAALLSVAYIGPALAGLPYTPEVRELMTGYMAIRLLGSTGSAIGLEAMGNFFAGQSRTRPAMVANIVAMVLNVALNWLLIDGHWGLPAMGVRGSALASAIATTAAFLGFFVYFLLQGRGLPAFKGSLAEFRRMLRFGLPSGLNWFLEFAAMVVWLNVIVGGLGTPILAALNSVFQINSVSFMPGFGLATAGSILVGQAIGADAKEEVPRIVALTLRVGAAWQCLVGVLYLVMPSVLMGPFAQGDDAAETLAAGVTMLMISAGWQLFDITANVYAESLRAAGDTLFPLLVRIAIAWVLWVGGSWVSVRVLHQGHVAAISWMVVYLAALAGVLVLRFRSGAWRRMELIDPVAAVP